MQNIAIISLSLSVLSLFFTVFYLIYSYFVVQKTLTAPRTSLLNTFPSEVADSKKRTLVLALLSFSAIYTLASYLSFYVGGIIEFAAKNLVPSAYYFILFFVVVGSISHFMTGFLGFKNSVRIPLIFCSLFFLSTASIGILSPLLLPRNVSDGELVNMFHINRIISWIFLALGFLSLFQLLNPKYKNWYLMQKTEVDGATIYIRPKVNWLATSLWSTYVLVSIYQVLFIVNDILLLI